MLIHTSRFGLLEIDDDRIVEFPDGLLGFPDRTRFALVQTSSDPVFFWLQAVDDPNLAFVVCDPLTFVADYQASIRQEDMSALGATDVNDCLVWVIVNKVDGLLTANLLGPLVVSATTFRGRQLVLSEKRYATRHVLMPAPAPLPATKIA